MSAVGSSVQDGDLGRGVEPGDMLGELADISVRKGAPSIRTENALLSAYIYVDTRDADLGAYVRCA